MQNIVRAMVIPFFIVLFPAAWYINRNVMTEQLPPTTEPTIELVALSIGGAIIGGLIFAIAFVFATPQNRSVANHELPYRQRVFDPEKTAFAFFGLFIAVALVWFIIEISGFGPSLLADVMSLIVSPLGLPLLVLGPLAIHFHWAVILGLILCVVWISFLSTVCSDIVHHRPLPLLNRYRQ